MEQYRSMCPRETGAVERNLERVMTQLNQERRLGGFHFGFFRSEGGGLYRIGQTGVPAARETRLYVYPDEVTHAMHVLGIGDKHSQSRDIRRAKHALSAIRTPSQQKTIP